MTWLSRFTLFFFAVALSCATAIAFLVHQNARGIPLSFATNMTLAGLLGLGLPVATVLAFVWWRRSATGVARFAVYYAACLVAIGLLVFLTV